MGYKLKNYRPYINMVNLKIVCKILDKFLISYNQGLTLTT